MKWFSALFCCSVCLISNWFHHVERRAGVKRFLLREAWLIAGERCSNSVSYASKRDRSVSIKYETAGTGDDFAGEDFQNRGTFIVVKFSVFAKSSAQKTHLARDAYNAYWDIPVQSQERNCAPEFLDEY
ncbi:MAG: hypothetical protein K0U86_15000 [Planctomycetes bacterium]|nr:hypothetical protein [Planctomycetota bacterium]MCH9726205.1 hypothetical protein [Planctomycetota bacterium]MCH9775710.1 hypothetical protein [Planctomycetota bacterium]